MLLRRVVSPRRIECSVTCFAPPALLCDLAGPFDKQTEPEKGQSSQRYRAEEEEEGGSTTAGPARFLPPPDPPVLTGEDHRGLDR